MTLHGDHASVFYQIPVNAKKTPLIFLHGHGQSVRSWQTTADGREGFDTLFLRKGYGVYPNMNAGVAFPKDKASQEQFFFAK